MFPYSFALTSHLYITFFLSLSFFYGLFIIAIRFKDVFFFSIVYPSGVPLPLVFFLLIIEMMSYLGRLLSLAVRLFANIMAGHILIKILSQFAWILFFSSFFTIYYFILFYFLFTFIILIFFLEVGVAFIQSYVFLILQLVYMGEIFSH